jgi:4-nitrophenyl phosphatase
MAKLSGFLLNQQVTMNNNRNTPPQAFILDMDGVVWRGTQPVGDLPALFAKMARRGYKVSFATNNATASPENVRAKLAGFGVKVDLDQIVTSAMAVASYLQEKHPQGGPVYIIGEEGLIKPLQEAGFYPSEKDCLAVVAGMDHNFNFEKLTKAARIIRSGVVFIGTNPDKTFPSPEGLSPGTGSLLAGIETASGITPQIIGKPYPSLFQLSMKRMGVTADRTLVVGDRLETDILGGYNAGCPTALVLTGVATRAEGEAFHPQPDWIANSLTELVDSFDQ